MSLLLDTNVISEVMTRQPDERVLAWFGRQRTADLYLSSITIGELVCGAMRKTGTRRDEELASWVEDDLVKQFEHRILVFDLKAARRWGDMMAEGDITGNVLPAADAQIAAIAQVNGLSLVTRNTGDFDRMMDDLVNPFEVGA